ncbi:MAG: DUF6159 family protein [Gammaproteobacteria bacterium]|nr:DUF6159 family protein [Gammaproteobacteria bacterium]
MQNHFSTGIQIAKQSFSVLKKHKILLIFPVVSMILILTTLPFIFLLTLKLAKLTMPHGHFHLDTKVIIGVFTVLFLLYAHWVTVLCNSALSACALKHIKGETYSVLSGFKQMFMRFSTLSLWALISGTVGIIIQIIDCLVRKNITFEIISNYLMEFAWAVASFFVLPIMMTENLSPTAAIKRSTQLIKENWGASLVSYTGIGLILFFLICASFVPLLLALHFGGKNNIRIGGGATLILFLVVTIFSSAVTSISKCAIYLYATTHKTACVNDYDFSLFKDAFQSGKKGNS